MPRILISMMLVVVGCSKPSEPAGTTHFDEHIKPIPEAGAMVNQFAFDLFAELGKTESGKNIFISPYSISTALGMTATGARGTTFEQMKKVLHLPGDATADAYYANLAAVLKGGKGYELSTANAVWAQSGMPWEEPFKNRLKGYGVDAFREVSFTSDSEAARKQVNDWAEKQTKEKIKELLKPKTVDGNTRMVLANAIYFKGDWETKFDPKLTKDGPFTNADKSKSTVPFMNHSNLAVEMMMNDQVNVVALPYAGNDLQMVIVLSKWEQSGLKSVEEKLNAETWNKWMKKLHKSEGMTVSLPKFKLETDYKLNQTLADQGMPDAFGAADFSGMTKSDRLFITLVAHKAFVELNEEGTEAAAATAVVLGKMSRRIITPFIVDRPFLFAIRHRGTGAILFLGRVEKL